MSLVTECLNCAGEEQGKEKEDVLILCVSVVEGMSLDIATQAQNVSVLFIIFTPAKSCANWANRHCCCICYATLQVIARIISEYRGVITSIPPFSTLFLQLAHSLWLVAGIGLFLERRVLILRPVLYNVFLIDWDTGLEGILGIFVDDTYSGGTFDSLEDREALQRDPGKLEGWAT